MGLIRYFAKKSILVNLIAIIVTITGFFIYIKSPKEIFPNIEFGIVVVNTIYPQASSEDVEKLITNLVEDAVKNIKGVKELYSSSSESLSMVIIQAEEGYDIKKLTDDVKKAVDKINNLPEEAEDPQVMDISSEEFGIVMLTVSGGTYGQRRDAVRLLENKTSKIPGIGKLEKWGYFNRAIWVNARKEDLKKYNITIFSLMNVLKDRNISMPVGNKKIGDTEYSLRLLSEQTTAEEISRIVVRSNDYGNNIRIGDIATVEDGYEEMESMTRADGEDAILVVYNKMMGYDAIKITKQIKKIVNELKESGAIHKDVKITFTDDFSERLKNRLGVLYSNGAFGAAIVIILLLIFLRPAVAIWVAVGLPVAIASTFIITNALGITFNMLSIFAFIMVIGMLVDDAIVVGENMFRHMEMGKKPFNAAVDGASEMILPILASVSTTIAAFLPLLMVGGMMGKMMGVVPIIISIALTMSVFECFFILPSHLSDFVKENKKYTSRSDHWFSILKEKYGAALNWVLHRRRLFGIIIAGAFFLSVVAVFVMDKKFSDTQINEITIKFDTPNTFGLTDTSNIVAAIEKKLLTLPKEDVDNIISYVGFQEDRSGPPKFAPNLAHIRVLLKLQDKRKTKDANKIVNKIKEMIGKREELSKLTVEVVKGGPSMAEDISITITGDTYEEIQKAAEELKAMIKDIETPRGFNKKVKPVLEVNTDLETGKKEIKFIIDEPKAMRVGVSIAQTASLLRAAISGLTVKSIKTQGENVDLNIRLNKEDIKSVDDILDLTVSNMMGQMIPLRSFVKIEQGVGYTIIKHKDGKKSVKVYGTVDKVRGNAAQVNMEIMKKFKEFQKKYPNLEFKTGGEFQAMTEAFRDLAFAFVVAVFIIYAILATLFNSLTQPFIIMLAIPFGFVGVVLTLILHMQPITFMAFMGFVGLTGVVVNNSILMTSFIDRLKQKAKNAKDFENAIIEGAKLRLRPIILTSVTTSAGLLPMAYGLMGGSSDPFLQPMALVFAWGLIFATLVTLFIIPVFIVIWNNLLVRIKDKLSKKGKYDFLLYQ
ncbi:MAG: efflux RND transporter permease subunit [Candidatus Goldbacteria bacterium]|nr:efflux RND transporter permease subunit [Candidatus Goldiibacteriota bacterium]